MAVCTIQSAAPVPPRRNQRSKYRPTDLRSQADQMLHELAYVYQLTASVRKAIEEEAQDLPCTGQRELICEPGTTLASVDAEGRLPYTAGR